MTLLSLERALSRAVVVLLLASAVTAGTIVACSSDDEPRATDPTRTPDGSVPRQNGAASDSATDGSTSIDGATIDGATVDPPLPALCTALVVDGGVRLTTITTTRDAGEADDEDASVLSRFNGVSPLFTALAWTDDRGDVYVAFRTPASGGDFAPPTANFNEPPIRVGTAIVAPGARVALAPSADRVIAPLGPTLVAYDRATTSPSSSWTGPSTTELGAVNTWLGTAGGTPAEPVIGSSGRTLFFLRVPGSGPPVLCESAWDDATGAWATPTVHSEADLTTDDVSRRRPTGVAPDGRTLFFWDEKNGIERTATRDAETGAFTTFANLGAFAEAAPNQLCDVLYFQSADDAGPGIFSTGDGK